MILYTLTPTGISRPFGFTEDILMLHFADLTPEQIKIICNGCGPKGGLLKVPDFLFKASCNHHDFRYWRGCSEQDRFNADTDFLTMMLIDAGEDHELQAIAHAYFMAVRCWGFACFHYADLPRAENDLALLFA